MMDGQLSVRLNPTELVRGELDGQKGHVWKLLQLCWEELHESRLSFIRQVSKCT